MLKPTILSLFLLLASLQVTANELPENLKVFGESNKCGMSLLVPGLNFNPEAFEEIINDLTNKNMKVYLLHLRYSHEKNASWDSDDLASEWIEQIETGISYINKIANSEKTPFNILGYSLGALSTETYLQNLNSLPNYLVGSTYLAPAFHPKAALSSILGSSSFLPNWLKIPSFNLEEYRTRWFTYVGEYEALLQLSSNFQSKKHKEWDLKTNLIMSPYDELLDYDETSAWMFSIRKQSRIQAVKLESEKLIGKNHLIVDSKSLNSDDYNKIITSLTINKGCN